MSADAPVHFISQLERPGPFLSGLDSETSHENKRQALSRAIKPEILSAQVKLAGEDPFGPVLSGQLEIFGRLKAGVIRKASDFLEKDFLCLHHPDFGERNLPRLIPDDFHWWNLSEPEHSIPEQRNERHILCLGLDAYSWIGFWGWCALAIELVDPDPNTYKRIGFVSTISSPEWFHDAPRQWIKLIYVIAGKGPV